MQVNDDDRKAKLVTGIILPPKTPAPSYVGKQVEAWAYYISMPTDLENILTKTGSPQNHYVTAEYDVWSNVHSRIYKNGVYTWNLGQLGTSHVESGGRIFMPLELYCDLIDYDKKLPVWKKKAGHCNVKVKYVIILRDNA